MIELKAIPLSDLRLDAHTSRLWHATGSDPLFLLELPHGTSQIPPGWLSIDFEISYADGERRPRLFWDEGDGFSERQSILLPLASSGRSARYVFFHKAIRGLRLDPAECECVFELGRLRVQGSTRAGAAFAALRPYVGRVVSEPRAVGRFGLDVAELFWRRGIPPIRAALRELMATNSGAAMRRYVSVQLNAARLNAARAAAGPGGQAIAARRFGALRGAKRMRIGIGLVEHIGDIVACEPVARQVREQYPDAEICWVVREPFRELIDSNPVIDTTIAVDCLTDWIKWRAHGVFDRVVDLHVNQRVCQHCMIPLSKNDGDPAITGNNHFNYGGLLKAFSLGAGLVPKDAAPRVYITPDVERTVDELRLPERFVVLHCRSNNLEKDWDYSRWTELARRIAQAGCKVVEIGLEPTVADASLGVINLCGRTGILQMAEVISRAALFVGVDSGPAHLANAVGAHSVILLGQLGPFKSYNPFSGVYGSGQRVTVVRNDNGPAALLDMEPVWTAVSAALHVDGTHTQRNAAAETRVGVVQPSTGQMGDTAPRLIAFYLPQYHPIPLNDRAWGKGFTEWRNVGKSRAYFDGQYQPRLPGELGYYDLRVPEVMEQQADLAREHGIHGFCYYYYWFNGTRLLHLPLDNMLRRRKPDFPFCFCWANENWTRRWDGMDKEILAGQNHTPEDDIAFLRFIMPALEDPRYIRVNGKPLLLVYRTELFPDPQATAERWREESIKAGIGDLFLVRCEGFDPWTTPDSIGFDASYEVPTFILPDELKVAALKPLNVSPEFKGRIYDYGKIVDYYCSRPETPYRRYRGPMLAWDNTPRHNERAVVFHDVTADKYERWIRASLDHARRRFVGEERLLFVNAWNEWAEGSYLEPDLKYGRQFLEATKQAVSGSVPAVAQTPSAPVVRAAA
jgi:ADP-heptose:LPS heptosyltransferase